MNDDNNDSKSKDPVVLDINNSTDDQVERRHLNDYQTNYLHITLILSILCILFSFLMHSKWNNSALLYIGIPIVLALLVAVIQKPESLVGGSLKGLTIFLLLSMILFREGTICILMAAPILYPVTAMFAYLIKYLVKRNKSKASKIMASPFVIILILLSLEGTHPALTIERTNTVFYQQIINASANEIKQGLSQPMSFDSQQDWITIIFPKPVKTSGSGLNIGDVRTVDYVYYKHFIFNPHKGSTTFKIHNTSENSVTFIVPEDTSYISHYLQWNYSKVSWQKIDSTHTKLVWELSYDRKLDPSWYFSPLQEYFVGKTTEYLVDNLQSIIQTTDIK